MKKIEELNVSYQALAIRTICREYTDEYANKRYKQLIHSMRENEVIAQLLHMIGNALTNENKELDVEIEKEIEFNYLPNVIFDSYRYCMTRSREMIRTIALLMGW